MATIGSVAGGIFEQIVEPTRNETVSVGTSSTVISQARNGLNRRKVLLVRNISSAAADIITVTPQFGQAVANAGIVLQPGESYSDSEETGYSPFQGMITAICATANGSLSIHER